MKILFTYLTAFSQSGGIEKFNRAFCKALSLITEEKKWALSIYSLYDKNCSEKYVSETAIFKGFGKNKTAFLINFLWAAFQNDIIVIGHLNLGILGLWIKFLMPNKKIILVAHGIEVWEKKGEWKEKLLQKADFVLAVSEFTKQKLIEIHGVEQAKIYIFPNTIDPFFELPKNFKKPIYIQARYHVGQEKNVILTLCRISSGEKYKGYDKVIEALPQVLKKYPQTVYMLAGKYDTAEKTRLDSFVLKYDLVDKVIFGGYIDDKEITDHYLFADVFVMPSKKEGFGIVFLEALACGIPVVGGNQDGSVDALRNGELGTLINPDNIDDLAAALIAILDKKADNNTQKRQELQQKAITCFGFEQYKNRLAQILSN